MLDNRQEQLARLWIKYIWNEYDEDGAIIPKKVYTTIGLLLGYPVAVDVAQSGNEIKPYSTTDGTPQGNSEYHELVNEIVEIKVALQQAYRDSMATEVGDLKLDMGSYINSLKHSGSSKLALLSKYTGIPVQVDYFTGRVYETSTTPYTIKNLF